MTSFDTALATLQADITSKLADDVTGGIHAASLRTVETDIVTCLQALNTSVTSIAGLRRADIATKTIPFTRFLTQDGAPWKSGSASGPGAVQDATLAWYELDPSQITEVKTEWFEPPHQVADYAYSGTDGQVDASVALNKAINFAVASGITRVKIKPGTYFLSAPFQATIDFTSTPKRFWYVDATDCTFVAMTGYASGQGGLIRINRTNTPAQGIQRSKFWWNGGFFDATRIPNTAFALNDCFSLSLPYCDVRVSNAEAYAGPKDGFYIAGGGTNGSDSGFGIDAETLIITNCKATGFPDAGFYLTGGSDESRIQKAMTLNNIEVTGCAVGIVNKRITQDALITNIRGDTCSAILATGPADTAQHADSIKAEGYVISNVTGRNCETIIQMQPATRAIISNIVNVDPGYVITGKTSTGSSAIVLRGAQNCIIDGVLTKGKNPAIVGAWLSVALNVGQLSANGSTVTQSQDNIVRNISAFDVDYTVLEANSSTRNYYEVVNETGATAASTIKPGSYIFNPFRGATKIGAGRPETTGTVTLVYGTDACFNRWAGGATLTGNLTVNLSTAIVPPDGASFLVQSPGNLGGFTFTVNGVSLEAAEIIEFVVLGGAWQARGRYFASAASIVNQTGSWTPTLTFGGGSTGITYSSQAGAYTRIGNRVFCEGSIILTNKGSSVGAATISGLPFTVGTFRGTIDFNKVLNMSGLTGPIYGSCASTSIDSIFHSNASGSLTIQDTNFTNTTDIRFQATYTVT